jgi:hypothetical protein
MGQQSLESTQQRRINIIYAIANFFATVQYFNTVPCARFLSRRISSVFGAVLEDVLLGHAHLSFLLPPPLFYFLSYLELFLGWDSGSLQCRFPSGNRLVEIGFGFFSKSCFGTRRSALPPWSADATSTG